MVGELLFSPHVKLYVSVQCNSVKVIPHRPFWNCPTLAAWYSLTPDSATLAHNEMRRDLHNVVRQQLPWYTRSIDFYTQLTRTLQDVGAGLRAGSDVTSASGAYGFDALGRSLRYAECRWSCRKDSSAESR